ncbi:hypothetical protein BH11PSE2_BH11PSE2_06190 [soil metagenome]
MKRTALTIAVASLCALPLAGAAQSTDTVRLPGTRQTDIPGAGAPKATGDFDRAPQWIQQPRVTDIQSVFPAAALRAGRDGTVSLKCKVTVDGGLRNCSTANEGPLGFSFGEAALALAPQFTLKPASKAGKAVESDVVIPITFIGPSTPVGSNIPGSNGAKGVGTRRIVQNPAWLSAPSYGDMLAAFPAGARAKGQGGRTNLNCTFSADGGLKGCAVLNEEPQGMGFGQAAQGLASRFKASPKLGDGVSVTDLDVIVPFTFSSLMLQNTRPPIGQPHWTGLPSDAELGSVFPAKAKSAGVGVSQVSLLCTIGEGGVLGDCRSLAESPTGFGFGDAAVAISSRFVVSPWSDDGLPTIGARVRVPLRYEMKVAEAAPAPRP